MEKELKWVEEVTPEKVIDRGTDPDTGELIEMYEKYTDGSENYIQFNKLGWLKAFTDKDEVTKEEMYVQVTPTRKVIITRTQKKGSEHVDWTTDLIEDEKGKEE